MPNTNINRKVVINSTGGYNANAILLFNAVGDVPEVVKPYFSDLIQAFEDSGVWTNTNFWAILCVPSLNAFNTLIEVKSLTVVSSFNSATTPPYNTARAEIPTHAGYKFNGLGYIKTGFIPSVKQILNDSSEFIVLYSDEVAANTYNYGAFSSISSSGVFTSKLNTNALLADAYSTTVGTGRLSVASASGSKGVYIKNRRSTSYMSVLHNGNILGTITGNNGTLPSVEVHLNSFNNNGTVSTRRNQSPIAAWGSFGKGLTATQETQLSSALVSWQTSMQRIDGSHNKQIVLDGNSHTVYWLSKTMRTIDYNLICQNWKFTNVGVSGQTTAQMSSDYASEVAPLYNGSLTKNILMAIEATNDIWFNGDVAGAKTRFATYVSDAQATGYTVIASPIMCRGFSGNPGGLTETAFNLAQDEFNQWLMAGNSGANYLTPIDPDYFIWRSAYASDAAYNTAVTALFTNTDKWHDTTHRTEAGYKKWGDQLTAAALLV